jgi:hypothetical protein
MIVGSLHKFLFVLGFIYIADYFVPVTVLYEFSFHISVPVKVLILSKHYRDLHLTEAPVTMRLFYGCCLNETRGDVFITCLI